MSIFKKRTLKPSQLASLRQFEATSLTQGRVVAVSESVAVVEGLNNDAEVGTSLRFSARDGSGVAVGVLLWRRD